MRARLLALEGVARGRIGDRLGQIQHFEQVMEIDPVYSAIGCRIASRMGGGSGVDGDVLKALSRSPRFNVSNDGLSLQATGGQVCLLEVWGKSLRARSFQLEMTR